MDPTGARRPVQDWATDFDHLSPEWADDEPAILADLRRRCPVAHTERFHGAYLVTRYEDVVAAAHDTATFSNRITAVNENDPAKIRLHAPPITLDPPLHGPARRALLPPFAPRAVGSLAPMITEVCDAALDRLAGRTEVDAAADYARVVSVQVMANLLGLPLGDRERFHGWVKGILSDGLVDLELAARCTREVRGYFAAQLAEPGCDGRDDLVGWVARVEEFDERDRLGVLYLLLVAGVDTTWSAIGSALHHLSDHPADAARLVAEPSLLTTAVEEFLRFFSPVMMGRVIEADGEVGGCPVQAGQRLLISFGSANRDPAVFADPDEVRIDRADNRHLAFGVGVHRCLGSNLARLELRIALERWLARVPRFEPAGTVAWTIGVRGPQSVPLRLPNPLG